MLLAELIEPASTVRFSPKLKRVQEDIDESIEEVQSVVKYLKGIGSLNHDLLTKISTAGTKKISGIMNDSLPNGILDWPIDRELNTHLRNGFDNITARSLYQELNSCPRGRIQQIRELCETLGLVIIPYEYACYTRIKQDRYPEQKYHDASPYELADNFNECTKANKMTSWMIAPVQYYSIENNVKNMEYDFFVPSSATQAFMALKLVMPLLIRTISQVDKLSSTVREHGIDIDSLRKTVNEQQKQINGIQKQLEIERQNRIDAERRHRKQMEEKQKEVEELIRFMMFDPLMIAVPSSVKDINSYEGNVILGPCWGPEIEPLVANLLGIEAKNSYKTHETKMRQLFKSISR